MSFRNYGKDGSLATTHAPTIGGASDSRTANFIPNKKKSTAAYRVTKISDSGKSAYASLTVADIIRGSSVHARDLFSLALSTDDEDQREKKGNEPKRYYRSARFSRRNPSPVILPRGEKIIVCFGCIKAVIGKDEGLLFGSHDPNMQLLSKGLEKVLKERAISQYKVDPFEMIFLEEILLHVCSTWSRRILLYDPIVSRLGGISDEIYYSQANVQRLVPLKDSLQSFEMQISQALDCLTVLLNDDVDMVNLLLAEKAAAKEDGKKVDVRLHASVELLVEEYARQLQNLHQEVNFLLRKVEGNQDLVRMSLDTYRNQMLRFSVYLNVGAICLATSTTVAGYFGMNLIHGFESSEHAFASVLVGTTCVSAVVCVWCMRYLSASRMTKNAVSQYKEIKIITRALNNLNAVDYAVKVLADSDTDLTKDAFKSKLNDGSKIGREISAEEVDLLFDVLDTSKDGLVQKHELSHLFRKEQKRLGKY